MGCGVGSTSDARLTQGVQRRGAARLDGPHRGSRLPLGEEDVRVMATVRPHEICDDVAVVAPGEVLVRPVGRATDVVARVAGGR